MNSLLFKAAVEDRMQSVAVLGMGLGTRVGLAHPNFDASTHQVSNKNLK
jgi:hypothetical protein